MNQTITRPEKIYLDEVITIDSSTKVGHTYEGLKYLIEHYTHIMNSATPKQMDDKARQHFQNMIINMQLHVTLYEKNLIPTKNKVA